MPQTKVRIGELLVQAELLSSSRLEEALVIQKESGSRLGTVLIQQGFITEPQLIQALSKQLSIPWVSLWHLDISEQLLDLIPEEIVLEHGVLPIYIRTLRGGDKALYIAMDDPGDTELLEKIGETCGMTVKPMIAGPSEIASAILNYYGTGWKGAPSPPPEPRISSIPPPPKPREEAAPPPGPSPEPGPEPSPELVEGPAEGPVEEVEEAPEEESEEDEGLLLTEAVDEEEEGEEPEEEIAQETAEEEPIELTETVGEDEQEAAAQEPEAPAPPTSEDRDLFEPAEPDVAQPKSVRRGRFQPSSINLTFLDGTSISFRGKEAEKERARESADALETRIDAAVAGGQGGENLALAVKGILKTLMRRGLLTEGELDDLLKGK